MTTYQGIQPKVDQSVGPIYQQTDIAVPSDAAERANK